MAKNVIIIILLCLFGQLTVAQDYPTKKEIQHPDRRVVPNGTNVSIPTLGVTHYFRADREIYARFQDGTEECITCVDQGNDGAQGPQGIPGVDGNDGVNGQDGREVELRLNGTNLEWRYAGQSTWNDLGNIQGPQGNEGPQGNPGVAGSNGNDGQGFTGGSYNSSTGIVTFTSDDGLGFSTGDLRGQDGQDGAPGIQGPPGDPATDDQTLSFTSPNLSISGGNSVDLSAIQDGFEANTDNQNASQVPVSPAVNGQINVQASLEDHESRIDALVGGGSDGVVTNIELSGTILIVDGTGGAETVDVDLSSLQDGFEANTDGQILSLSNNDLSISNGNTVDLSGYVNDGFEANTDNQTLGFDGTNVSISNGNSVNISGIDTDTNTQLNQSEVAAFVNAEFPNLDTDDRDDFDSQYSSLIGAPTIPTNNNQLTNGAGYITTFTETDPTLTQSNVAALGFFPMVKLTQAAYDALSPPDPNTLYLIVN